MSEHQTWCGAVTQVTIEQLGDLGIEFATAPDGRVRVSAVDATSRNASATSAGLVIGQLLLTIDDRRVTELPTRAELSKRPLALTFEPRAYQRKLPMIALPEGFPPGCVQVENIKQMEAQLEQASLAAEGKKKKSKLTRPPSHVRLMASGRDARGAGRQGKKKKSKLTRPSSHVRLRL